MRMASSWSGPVAGRPDTRLWRAGPRPGAGSPPIVIPGHRPAACCRAAGREVPQPLALDTQSPIQGPRGKRLPAHLARVDRAVVLDQDHRPTLAAGRWAVL